jgi:hypothetical protein
MVIASFQKLPRNLPEGADENYENHRSLFRLRFDLGTSRIKITSITA